MTSSSPRHGWSPPPPPLPAPDPFLSILPLPFNSPHFAMVDQVLAAHNGSLGRGGGLGATAFPTIADVIMTTTAEPPKEPFSNGVVITLVAIGVIFAILTSVGNLMVMVSFKIDKQLQTISNYFLFSLAVADITIGLISIPLMTYYTVNQGWDIGYVACQFWLCVDYLMSNASVLNLLLISFDRYFSVTRPLTYRPRRTTKKALTMIACTYIISLILWPPWIISWPYIEGSFKVPANACKVQFLETNTGVTLGTAVAAFYLPVIIMIILYARVYWETKNRQREFGKLQANQGGLGATERTSLVVKGKKKKRKKRSVRAEMPSAPSSNSLSKQHSSVSRREKWSLIGQRNSMSRRRFSWLRACTARSVNSSEDSSEAAVGAGGDTASVSSSVCKGRSGRGGSRPHSPPQPLDESITTANGTRRNERPRCGSGVPTCNTGNDVYTVLIELNDEGSRPTVRLSNCEWNESIDSPLNVGKNNRLRSKSEALNVNDDTRKREIDVSAAPASGGGLSSGFGGLFRNGRAKLMNGGERKSEKERKKNERKQDSKAAKTLSAILFAFIATWTPYNVFVCWEAFFPGTVDELYFTIAYSLCYINSTINPLCYALCNARFRHTYKRILRCSFGAERPSLAQQAYYRRN